MKSYEEINEKIAAGRAVVLTAEERSIQRGIEFIREHGVSVNEAEKGLRWDQELCTHCGNCLAHCPVDALYIADHRSRVQLRSGQVCRMPQMHPHFARSLIPLEDLAAPSPESAGRMHRASRLTGVGPMAAVADACTTATPTWR